MSTKQHPRPPRWAERLLCWYCRPELLEDLQGDLNEYFQRNLESSGKTKARLTYALDVLKFMRPYTLRKPPLFNPVIHWIMFGNYIKTSGRNLVRNKLFSSINVIGLSISMSVGLLLISMLADLSSYDKFHANYDRIYRVSSHYKYRNQENSDPYATTSLKAARLIEQSVTGIEDVAVLQREFAGDLTFNDKTIPFTGLYANPATLTIFSFPLLEGNASTALREPFSLVLTETAATKLFGNTDAVGSTVILNGDREYTVTGVMKDVPLFSHVQFEMLCSLSTREVADSDNKRAMAWDNIWNTWTYLLLPPDADIASLTSQFNEISEKEDQTVEHVQVSLSLQPLGDIITGDNLSNQIGQTMGRTPVRIFLGLVAIVILSACFNYTNLSVARSFKRAREVGIRKAIGAYRLQVVYQFMVESVVISLISLLFAFILFLLIRPHFRSLEDSLQTLLRLEISPELILIMVVFAVVVGCAAGLLPSIFFARMNTIQVLKKISVVPAFKNLSWRRALIVFQYCISIIGITATLILYQQYEHFVSYDLGYSTQDILNIRIYDDNNGDVLKQKLMTRPYVQEVSKSVLVTSTGNYWGTTMKNPNDPTDSSMVYYNTVDENYLPVHGHTLLAGKNFVSQSDSAEESEVIVNEAVLRRFDIAGRDPQNAVGEVVSVDRKNLRIIGVLKDFSYGRPNNRTPGEVVLRTGSDHYHYLNVKVSSSDRVSVLADIETIWKDFDPVHPFLGQFYDDQIEEAFKGLNASFKVGGFLALLVICIASIGLLGMVVFTTETRLREVSIRKVFGAGEIRLLYLLSRNFLLLLLLAIVIAIPATYFFFENVLLPEINNHAPIRLIDMFGGMIAVVAIALIMIATQTVKISRANPAEVLKTE